MLRSLATTALLVSSSLASPALIQRRDDPNTGLTWIYKDPTLPKRLYNTGDGTILSGSANGRLDTTSYGGGVGGLTPETLIGNVSEVLDIAQLVSAFYATKTNGNTISTFLSPDQGYLAQFMSGQPYFFYGASLPKARHYFNPLNLTSPLPKVDVVYGHRTSAQVRFYDSFQLTALQRASMPASSTQLPIRGG